MNWLSFLDFLAEPTFIDRSRAPIKVSAKVMGWIALGLSVLFLIALLLVGVGSTLLLRTSGHSGIFALALIGLVLLVIAQVGMVVGAWQMTQGNHSGRRLLIQALALSVVFSLIYNIGLANLAQFIVQLVIRAVLYYFVVISRFPDEERPAASTT